MDEELQARGIAAAAGYLERIGFADVERTEPVLRTEGISLRASEGDTRVAVAVRVSRAYTQPCGCELSQHLPDGFDRLDVISILVLDPAEDSSRALLRHHRAVCVACDRG